MKRARSYVQTAWLLLACALPVAGGPVDADFTRTARTYRLLDGSEFVDDCGPCARPVLLLPLRGTLWLRPGGDCWNCPGLLQVDLSFSTPEGASPAVSAKGDGSLRLLQASTVDGPYFRQELRLRLWIRRGPEGAAERVEFDSGVVPLGAPLPWLDVRLEGNPKSAPLTTFRLRIVAVPWTRLLFSTARPLGRAEWAVAAGAGDLLSPDGMVVLENADLTGRLGIMPVVPDLGLDAALLRSDEAGVQEFPVPEILFSTTADAFSETLGSLDDGDLLSAGGSIVLKKADWLKPFRPRDPVPDVGLDAVAVLDDGTYVFSTTGTFYSIALGRSIRPGDVLAADGKIFRSEEQLLAGFRPAFAERGPGVDALFVWPHGEIWFSTERDFSSAIAGKIGHGDLLSDTGRVVLRNGELLEAFGPLKDTAGDFGLDAVALEATPVFSDCGFLVDGVECLLFQADCGGRYVISNPGDFAAGDRVRVTGKLVDSCVTTCQQGDGCLYANTIEACDFDGCGRLVEGLDGCVLFEAASGKRLLLENIGDFQVGDRVRVIGRVERDCESACVSPCARLVANFIEACVFEDCGRLVDLGGGCLVFEDAAGDRYLIENVGEFAAGDEVVVRGELSEDCVSPCASDIAAAAKGCIRDNEVDTAGPVGEVGFFRRGDCNADGAADLSDAVYHLLYLFSSGDVPLCPDACNSNGDAKLDVTDAIYTLGFLFTGGPGPLPPFPDCGEWELEDFCGQAPCPCLYPEGMCGALDPGQ